MLCICTYILSNIVLDEIIKSFRYCLNYVIPDIGCYTAFYKIYTAHGKWKLSNKKYIILHIFFFSKNWIYERIQKIFKFHRTPNFFIDKFRISTSLGLIIYLHRDLFKIFILKNISRKKQIQIFFIFCPKKS